MHDESLQVDEKNRWRLETPGHHGWQRTARPVDPNRYLMISSDCHANEPSTLMYQRIDEKFRSRLPHVEVQRRRGSPARPCRTRSARAHPRSRARRIDAEIVFPNKGLSIWATQDAEFGDAQCRVWNDWARETFGQ